MLQIVVDRNIEDKYRDSFVRALKRECENQNFEYKIVESEKGFVINKPYVITEPHNLDLVGIAKAKWDCDNFATARSILELLPKEPQTVLIIGRGKVVGRPLSNLVRDCTNHDFAVVNSHTNEFKKYLRCCDADIIINCANGVTEFASNAMSSRTLIDVNNMFKYTYEPEKLYNMRAIGKLTVEKIVGDAKKKVMKDEV